MRFSFRVIRLARLFQICLNRLEASLPRPIVQEFVIKTSIDSGAEPGQQKQAPSAPRKPRQVPYPPRPMIRPTGTPAPAPRPNKQGKQPAA
ncbi:MAG: hypothetical protein AB1452_08520 [Pseudomonadota bacterium]